MKRLLQLASVLALGVVVVVSRAGRAPDADDTARAAALKLFQSLSADQKKLAVKDFNDKERQAEQFPAVVRPGLPFAMLTPEQKTMVNDVVRAMTSEYGASRCLEVGKQTPENRRYLNYFGEPAAGKRFAWRIAQHHLTLVYAEFGADQAHEFGPILLGGNPVKDLWDGEEKIALALYASLSPQEVQAIEGKGKASPASGAPIGKSGLRIAELGAKPQALARSLLQQRLAVFAPDRRKVLEALIQRDGGIDNLRIAFWGAATKSQKDGGTYHWRIGSGTVVCDWQTVGRNHIHMTVRGRSKA
jgi:Protein of unknown function (DUF3500)